MNKISNLRKYHGLTQHRLADVLGVHSNTLAAWERGEIDPPTSKSIQMAKLFDVTVNELMTPTDAPAEAAEVIS